MFLKNKNYYVGIDKFNQPTNFEKIIKDIVNNKIECYLDNKLTLTLFPIEDWSKYTIEGGEFSEVVLSSEEQRILDIENIIADIILMRSI